MIQSWCIQEITSSDKHDEPALSEGGRGISINVTLKSDLKFLHISKQNKKIHTNLEIKADLKVL